MTNLLSSIRRGHVFVVLGIALALFSVLYVLEDANGPGAGPTQFEARRSYDMVKSSIQRTFGWSLLGQLSGLALCWSGARRLARERAQRAAKASNPG
jgi:hypothetical protein